MAGQNRILQAHILAATDQSARLFRYVFESDPASGAQAAPRLFDALQEPRIVFESVFEPVLFRFEADQHTRRFAMARGESCVSASQKTGTDRP
jgi:hypothetical protein